MLKENGDKLSPDDKKKLEDAIAKAKKDFESNDIEVIRKALEELTTSSNEVVTKMYQSAQNAQGANPEQPKKDDGDPEVVVDDNN